MPLPHAQHYKCYQSRSKLDGAGSLVTFYHGKPFLCHLGHRAQYSQALLKLHQVDGGIPKGSSMNHKDLGRWAHKEKVQ